MEDTVRLQFLGPVQVEKGGQPVRGFESRKALALLGYLATQGKPVPRQHLVDLLWGDKSEARGRANLSWVLNRISTLLPGCLQADRHNVQFQGQAPSTGSGQAPSALRQAQDSAGSGQAPYWLDIVAFEELEAQGEAASLAAAVELYQGEFLEGLYLNGCAEFEIWLVGERERWRQRVARVLGELVTHHGQRGGYQESLRFAWRLLALEPWREDTHRQVMRLLAYSGQRGAALAQYEICCRVLAEELDVEPAEETTRLYEQIRDGEWGEREREDRRDVIVALPPFLIGGETAEVERPIFVARERELAQLQGFLDAALAGQGRGVFVIGDAGSGKTALVQQFAWDAQAAHPELVVTSGHCNAHTGIGDPYLPFREVLALLTGDVEARLTAGAMPREQARRLWHTLPLTAQALVEAGPDLVDTFLPGAALVKRATTCMPDGADWLSRLEELVQRPAAASGSPHLQQSALFEQYAQVVETLASDRPLLLMLEDLQWADTGSTSLLFHLGRRIEGNQVLVVGVFRPEEVALGRRGERHPLEPVVNELQRHFGDIVVDLGQSEGRQFVDALLDAAPNRLGDAFRETLYQQTRGHPLFAVELLRGMQERGDLVQDQEGRWVEGLSLDWEALPARVEAVIAERIGRLAEPSREALRVASVEGEAFTAEVVAQVRAADEQEMMRRLSGELDRKHRLVSAQGVLRTDTALSGTKGGQRLSLYRFRHILFQRYLYNSLDQVERAHLHQAVGTALESLYGEGTEEIAVQLARHFQEAGIAEKAIDYLSQVGDRARGLYAHQEAIDYYQRALAFLKEQEEYERAARTLMKLGLTYHNAFDFKRAHQAYGESFALWQRAAEMEPSVLPPAPHALRQARIEPLTLDPTVAHDMFSVPVVSQLFSGLVDLSPEQDVVPAVAHSWEVGEGGCKYVFHLRDNVRWSDGTLLTAEDFSFTWHRLLDPATGAGKAQLLYDVKGARAFHQGQTFDPNCLGIQVLDPLTLVVELEQPTAYFLQLLASHTTSPVPRHVVAAHGEAWTEVGKIVTNGPFRLEAWNRGESMVLVRNPAYYDRFRGNVQRVELSFLIDTSAMLAKYEADSLDVLDLWGFTAEEMYRAQQQHAGEYISVPQLVTYYLGFAVRHSPFDDVWMRRAFALAADKETLASINRGGLSPATGGFVPQGMPGHSVGISLPYDPERARQLLAKAGYSKGSSRGFPHVTMLCPGHRPLPARASEHLCAQWLENLGVEVTWEAMEFGALRDKLERDPPPLFYFGLIADYPDPDDFLGERCPARRYSGWQNAAYKGLVEEARRATDQAERMRLYRQADRILVEEVAIIPLAYGRWPFLVKPWVRKYPITPSTKTMSWKDVIIEPH